MKTELLAQTGWRGKLNDRVLSAAFRTLEDLHIPRSLRSPSLSATFDTLVTLYISHSICLEVICSCLSARLVSTAVLLPDYWLRRPRGCGACRVFEFDRR